MNNERPETEPAETIDVKTILGDKTYIENHDLMSWRSDPDFVQIGRIEMINITGKLYAVGSVLRNIPHLERDGFNDSGTEFRGLADILFDMAFDFRRMLEAAGKIEDNE